MICADFLSGANLEDHYTLLVAMVRLYQFLPRDQRELFLEQVNESHEAASA
jgi:hypothetical protein